MYIYSIFFIYGCNAIDGSTIVYNISRGPQHLSISPHICSPIFSGSADLREFVIFWKKNRFLNKIGKYSPTQF